MDEFIKVLDRDAALTFLRSLKGKIFVRGAANLPTTDGRSFQDITCYIPVSKKNAAKYITDLLSDSFANRGAKIRINIAHQPTCTFIG